MLLHLAIARLLFVDANVCVRVFLDARDFDFFSTIQTRIFDAFDQHR